MLRLTVVSGILFTTDQVFRMEELTIGPGTDLVNWLGRHHQLRLPMAARYLQRDRDQRRLNVEHIFHYRFL